MDLVSNPPLVGLAGFTGAGKSTIANYLVGEFNFDKLGFTDPLKDMCEVIGDILVKRQLSWSLLCQDQEWKVTPIEPLGRTPRYIMQTLGTEWGRNLIHNDLWLILADARISSVYPTVFDDVRFDNEAEFIRDRGGSIWHIRRPSVGPGYHTSEHGVRFDKRDLIIENDFTMQHLENQVRNCLQAIGFSGNIAQD